MSKPANRSLQTKAVLTAFAETPERWWHGYDLLKRIGLKSGTLYPLLIRLHEQGLLDAEWHEPDKSGRPPRHAYRLTTAGLEVAMTLASDRMSPVARDMLIKPA